jgi:hypothetical protein
MPSETVKTVLQLIISIVILLVLGAIHNLIDETLNASILAFLDNLF